MSQQTTIPLLAHTKTNNGNRCLPAYLDLDLEFWIHHLFLCMTPLSQGIGLYCIAIVETLIS